MESHKYSAAYRQLCSQMRSSLRGGATRRAEPSRKMMSEPEPGWARSCWWCLHCSCLGHATVHGSKHNCGTMCVCVLIVYTVGVCMCVSWYYYQVKWGECRQCYLQSTACLPPWTPLQLHSSQNCREDICLLTQLQGLESAGDMNIHERDADAPRSRTGNNFRRC